MAVFYVNTSIENMVDEPTGRYIWDMCNAHKMGEWNGEYDENGKLIVPAKYYEEENKKSDPTMDSALEARSIVKSDLEKSDLVNDTRLSRHEAQTKSGLKEQTAVSETSNRTDCLKNGSKRSYSTGIK